jgi:hypothetical protein
MSADWVWVQQEVSGTTRVFAYDRAGMGWSEMATSKGDGNMTTIGAEIPETTEGVMILGVDTHLDFHVAVAINPLGRTPG